MTAQEVYREISPTSDVIRALVRAEKYGQAMAHGATILCTGYTRDATEFSAATALYAVRW